MLAIVGFLFLLILFAVLCVLYKNEIVAKKKSFPTAIAEEYWNGKERRKFVRFKKAMAVTYTVRKKPNLNHNHRCKTIDISEGGMKLLLDEKLDKGNFVCVQICIPDSGKIVEIEGEVVWSEDAKVVDSPEKRMFCLGMKFSAIKEPNGKHFMRFIRTIAAEPGLEEA